MRSFFLKSLVVGFVGFGVSAPARAALEFGIDGANPLSGSLYVDPNTGARNVPVAVYDMINPDSTPDAINSITVDPVVNIGSGDFRPASTLILVSGGQVIASQSVPAGDASAITFNNIQSFVIPSGTTQPFVVETNVPSPLITHNEAGSMVLLTKLAGVTYQNGGQNYGASPNIFGNPQYFFSAVPNLQFVTGSAFSESAPNGATQEILGSIIFTVTPQGGIMSQPAAGDFKIGVGTSLAQAESNILPTADLSIADITPQPSSLTTPLSQGELYRIVLQADAVPSQLFGTGVYQFYLLSAGTTVVNPEGGVVTTNQTWGLDNFTSGSVIVSVLPEPASASILGLGALTLLRRQRRSA
jgi:hypothetical protein